MLDLSSGFVTNYFSDNTTSLKLNPMGKSLILAFYITICCIAFVISKIIIAVLIYRRSKRKHLVFEHGFSGIDIVEIYKKVPHKFCVLRREETYMMLTDVNLQVGKWFCSGHQYCNLSNQMCF